MAKPERILSYVQQDEHKRLMAADKVLVIGGGIVGVELAGAALARMLSSAADHLQALAMQRTCHLCRLRLCHADARREQQHAGLQVRS